MSNLKKVNAFRRSLMRNLTKNIGNSNVSNTGSIDNSKIKKVLICRPNGRLGNMLLITPLVEEVAKTFPDCKIDVFVKGFVAPIVFENYEVVDKIIPLPKKPFKELVKYFKVWTLIKKQNYDMVINVDQNSSSGRLAVKFSNAKYKFFGNLPENVTLEYDDYEHIAKYPVYNFRYFLSQIGIEDKNESIALIDLKLSETEIANGKQILDKIIDPNKRTIAIFTFATGEKCYNPEWWGEFYAALKKEYPNENIFEVLPVENVSQINFEAPTFYSKDVREIGSVLANVDVFVGADSGIMHLSSASKAPTIGLFSVSNLKKYEPYGNGSVGLDTSVLGVPDFIKAINKILNK
ncbi:glycosyltransferase family 9 protein [Flavobacterium quisquiliarum]|jgi:ADP-heptose:LPS heptosyltransferase|uniref:Glycosyltransferase family 9 protein n=1 Tax=Flavobacterium quisquiliarum TaxID=1834436 RepID=A0ABV8W3Z6_9FLAO|nr:glycosyltransferase family 9 protein [Flavobacterium quisquiliarum]MBW1657065.1 lipopolysaccharide heptosyltransferase family protein [Flavobacterium quisquiliarum]NWK99731.1 ADP-heptose--LPS heptosyltransferase [Flavobacterium collinsii]